MRLCWRGSSLMKTSVRRVLEQVLASSLVTTGTTIPQLAARAVALPISSWSKTPLFDPRFLA